MKEALSDKQERRRQLPTVKKSQGFNTFKQQLFIFKVMFGLPKGLKLKKVIHKCMESVGKKKDE